ncbi:MAG: glycerol-3-phosphate dehydrogenase [Alphaproteobacteria bacterium]|nr:glycerol-3-phosphate dehydrogenase [Alphaproteobacteria bacterium]MDE2631184.1 glycerol-3-phosphate dehydrogenase [Alphaproteobacteria bacterium]
MSREGSLDAPVRHSIDWRSDDFTDAGKLDAEMRRVFDICHGCRRCFNLCDSFPRLFELIDSNPDETVEGVKSADFARVVEACTLCDMCFMTKCPYVPPHPFAIDFPHLMLRARAAQANRGRKNFTQGQLAEMDRNGRLARFVSPLVNWASSNGPARALMEGVAGIDRGAALPKFHAMTFAAADRGNPVSPNREAPAFSKRKAALYATCFVNFNKPSTGMAARAVLNHIGVETKVAYPGCCGMPFLERADLERVAQNAAKVSKELVKLIEQGYDIVALTASCGLMLKFEWKLILPDNDDVQKLARATFDINEYVVNIARNEGLPAGLRPLPEGVCVHLPCHARAQAMGPKAAEMLKLIPDTPIDVIARCSGHGGTFGVMKETHKVAVKIGRPVFRAALEKARRHIVSDCPLAARHIVENVKALAATDGIEAPTREPEHPIEIMACAFGLLEV